MHRLISTILCQDLHRRPVVYRIRRHENNRRLDVSFDPKSASHASPMAGNGDGADHLDYAFVSRKTLQHPNIRLEVRQF